VVRAAFKINPANTMGTEPKEQVKDAPGHEQEAGADAVLKSQGGAEAGEDEEEEGEPMEGLEEEKPAESQATES
jgi:hypothetical protein